MERMSQRQWKRLDVVERIGRGALTVGEAAQALGLSARHVRRLRRAVERRGAKAVVHGNTGRAPQGRIADAVRAQVVELRRTTYDGFNDTHFTEKLCEVEQIEVSRPSVQRILRAAGIGPPRRRRAPKHRRRRDRKPQAGLMILWDGSRHEWLEGRGPMLCLMAAIDDATGELLPGAHFVEQECAAGYLRVLRAIAEEKGLPCSAYMDRHGSLKRNDAHWTLEEELRGVQDPTQVGRALQALEIEVIFALSPQAKGRVERLWGTLQDRLVSELRLVGAATVEAANAVLTTFTPDHNRRFAIAAAEATPAWRPVRRGTDLARVCSFQYEATVLNDNTVRLAGVVLDIPPGPRKRSYAGVRVEVRQLLDGSWRVYHGAALIATAAATTAGELRSLPRRRRRPPSAASVGKTPGARRAPSVSPTAVIASQPQRARGGQNR
jgi:transposase